MEHWAKKARLENGFKARFVQNFLLCATQSVKELEKLVDFFAKKSMAKNPDTEKRSGFFRMLMMEEKKSKCGSFKNETNFFTEKTFFLEIFQEI